MILFTRGRRGHQTSSGTSCHAIRVYEKIQKNVKKMAYEVIILCHLHMPLYFPGTFTEYP